MDEKSQFENFHPIFGFGVIIYLDENLHLQIFILDEILRSKIFIRIFGLTRGLMNYLDEILRLQIFICIFSSATGKLQWGTKF